MKEYLESRDITVSSDTDFPGLLYLFNKYIDEIGKRGTLQILDSEEDGADIDGELFRLINKGDYEDFIFCLMRNYEVGWCLGKSSPTWKGAEFINGLNKSYEDSDDVEDLSKYPLLLSSYIEIEDDKMKISGVTSGSECGVSDVSDSSKRILIDPNIDYEISFFIEQSSISNNLNFGIDCFTSSGGVLSLENINSGDNLSYFFQEQSLKISDTTYWVRGVIFGSGVSLKSDSKTNLGIGNNLRFKSNAKYIVPKITVIGSSSQVTYLSKIRVRPLSLNFSRGQLGINPIVYILGRNNNDKYTESKLNKFITDTLLPYKYTLKSNWITE